MKQQIMISQSMSHAGYSIYLSLIQNWHRISDQSKLHTKYKCARNELQAQSKRHIYTTKYGI